jgi:SAM-dependent methyltransferase
MIQPLNAGAENLMVLGRVPMPPNDGSSDGEYVLATGAAAVRRLAMLHHVYSPAGRRTLLRAGLTEGMHVADFGCGVGMVTRMLAEMVGPTGHVTGIDVSAGQLKQAGKLCQGAGLRNVSFVEGDACATGLSRNSFDLAYCRFLLMHLPDPASCLREMRDVLKPGGILVVEDGDLASAVSIPSTALNAFADLFARLGPVRGVDYSLGNKLLHLVRAAGFADPGIEIHQPPSLRGESRHLLKWSVEEARNAFIDAGLISADHLQRTLASMQAAIDDPRVMILPPRASQVWARK